jgi:hypothetical protein
MNKRLLHLLNYIIRHHVIGAKHAPESLMFRFALKKFNKDIQKEFYRDYELLSSKNYFIRLKKRTGKGSEYHISLNPEMIDKLEEIIGEKNEIS